MREVERFKENKRRKFTIVKQDSNGQILFIHNTYIPLIPKLKVMSNGYLKNDLIFTTVNGDWELMNIGSLGLAVT